MLPKPHRLSRKDDISNISKGRGIKGNTTSIKFIKNSLDESRFGFIISSKALKKANERNLVKRRAREIMRKNLSKIKKGYDTLFIFSNRAGNLSYNELEQELLDLLNSSKLLV